MRNSPCRIPIHTSKHAAANIIHAQPMGSISSQFPDNLTHFPTDVGFGVSSPPQKPCQQMLGQLRQLTSVFRALCSPPAFRCATLYISGPPCRKWQDCFPYDGRREDGGKRRGHGGLIPKCVRAHQIVPRSEEGSLGDSLDGPKGVSNARADARWAMAP